MQQTMRMPALFTMLFAALFLLAGALSGADKVHAQGNTVWSVTQAGDAWGADTPEDAENLYDNSGGRGAYEQFIFWHIDPSTYTGAPRHGAYGGDWAFDGVQVKAEAGYTGVLSLGSDTINPATGNYDIDGTPGNYYLDGSSPLRLNGPDGQIVWCIEANVPVIDGSIYDEIVDPNNPLYNNLNFVAWEGYLSKYGDNFEYNIRPARETDGRWYARVDPGNSTQFRDYLFTQRYMQEMAEPNTTGSETIVGVSGSPFAHRSHGISHYAEPISHMYKMDEAGISPEAYYQFKAEMDAKLVQFTTDVDLTQTEISLEQSGVPAVVTDLNDVLSSGMYDLVSAPEGITAYIDGNDIHIFAEDGADTGDIVFAMSFEDEALGVPILYEHESSQNVITGGFRAEGEFSIRVTGTPDPDPPREEISELTAAKLNQFGEPVEGATFGYISMDVASEMPNVPTGLSLQEWVDFMADHGMVFTDTDANGQLLIEGLEQDAFVIFEIQPPIGYVTEANGDAHALTENFNMPIDTYAQAFTFSNAPTLDYDVDLTPADLDMMNGQSIITHTEASIVGGMGPVSMPMSSAVVIDFMEMMIQDTVTYEYLDTNAQYEVVTSIYNQATEELVEQSSRNLTVSNTHGTFGTTTTLNKADVFGETLVVFQEVYLDGALVASHTDFNAESQMVTIEAPEIGTTATNPIDGSQVFSPQSNQTLIDVVEYADIPGGMSYRLVGELMVKETGEPTGITGMTSFGVSDFPTGSGTVEVEFEFDARDYRGQELVVFETLEIQQGGSWVTFVEHHDLDDEDQTVYVLDPDVGTRATNAADGSQIFLNLSNQTLIDTVDYTGLFIGGEYMVSGELMQKSTDENGNVIGIPTGITGSAEFVAESADGTVEVPFTFDASQYAGESLVVFETLYQWNASIDDWEPVAEHHDPEDEDQTVYVTNPDIGTTASNPIDGTQFFLPMGTLELIDTVAFEDIAAGYNYRLNGELMVKETGESTGITASTEFTTDSADGTVEVSFDVNTFDYAGQELVVFETLEVWNDAVEEWVTLVEHHDIDDEAQTVYVTDPDIGTTATNPIDGSQLYSPISAQSLVDTVAYSDILPGYTYRINGELFTKAMSEDDVVIGETTGLTGSTEFVAESGNGMIDVPFELDVRDFRGQEIVVYETLDVWHEANEEWVTLVEHHDIEDTEQTVYVTDPDIGTTAFNPTDLLQLYLPIAEQPLVDTVAFEDLIVGLEYRLDGEIMIKTEDEDGNIIGESTGITNSVDFTAESVDGEIDIPFELDVRDFRGQELVVYETLSVWNRTTEEWEVIVEHHDPEDDNQTVEILDPDMGTLALNAVGEDLDVFAPTEEEVLIDYVAYENLLVGHEYRLSGELVEQESGRTTEIYGETTFVAEEADGVVEVRFDFDATPYRGTHLVVFETLEVFNVETEEWEVIVEHLDLEDKDQTVHITDPGITTEKSVDLPRYERGDTLTYTFTVTNTGDIDLHDLVFEDAMFPNEPLELATLRVGEVHTFELEYNASRTDVEENYLLNCALFGGTTVNGYYVDSKDCVVSVGDPDLEAVERPVEIENEIIIDIVNKNTNEVENTITIDTCDKCEVPCKTCETPEPPVEEDEEPTEEEPTEEEPTEEEPTEEEPTEEEPTEEEPTEEEPTEEEPTEEEPTEEEPTEEEPTDEPNGDDNNDVEKPSDDGELPNTGGAMNLWTIIGGAILLVGGGTLAVILIRRRNATDLE